MILANSHVAKQLYDVFPTCALLRNHKRPTAAALTQINDFVAQIGCDAKMSGDLQSFIEEVHGIKGNLAQAKQQLIMSKIIRSLNQAEYISTSDYSQEDFYHFGLGLDFYTHFTSPIRRYADIIVHRLLLASLPLNKQRSAKAFATADERAFWEFTPPSPKALSERCSVLNKMNASQRRAGSDSRNAYLVLYFKQLNEKSSKPIEYDGLVTEITPRSLKIELVSYGCTTTFTFSTKNGECLLSHDTLKRLCSRQNCSSETPVQHEVVSEKEVRFSSACGCSCTIQVLTGVKITVQPEFNRYHGPRLSSLITSLCESTERRHEKEIDFKALADTVNSTLPPHIIETISETEQTTNTADNKTESTYQHLHAHCFKRGALITQNVPHASSLPGTTAPPTQVLRWWKASKQKVRAFREEHNIVVKSPLEILLDDCKDAMHPEDYEYDVEDRLSFLPEELLIDSTQPSELVKGGHISDETYKHISDLRAKANQIKNQRFNERYKDKMKKSKK